MARDGTRIAKKNSATIVALDDDHDDFAEYDYDDRNDDHNDFVDYDHDHNDDHNDFAKHDHDYNDDDHNEFAV